MDGREGFHDGAKLDGIGKGGWWDRMEKTLQVHIYFRCIDTFVLARRSVHTMYPENDAIHSFSHHFGCGCDVGL